MKVNEIIDGLWVRGHSEHLPIDDKRITVAEKGITHAVNLWSRPDPGLQALVANYWHRPMPDGKTVPDWLPGLAQTLAEDITDHGAGVLIQCHAGRNRSGLLAAAVLHFITGLPGDDCLEFVRTKRPDAVDNDAFEMWLEGLG